MKIFCYGSNMEKVRMCSRCPSAKFLSVGTLGGWQLVFNKKSKDGSSKANLQRLSQAKVWGVVWSIDDVDKPALDRAEGLGRGYEQMPVKVFSETTGEIECLAYVALEQKYLESKLGPHSWYSELVLLGAHQWSLPPEWIKTLEELVLR